MHLLLLISTAGLASASQFERSSPSSNISLWDVLNSTVGGRLQSAKPVSAPCFSIFDGQDVAVDSAACAEVRNGYSSPEFRSPRFGAYMMVILNCDR